MRHRQAADALQEDDIEHYTNGRVETRLPW